MTQPDALASVLRLTAFPAAPGGGNPAGVVLDATALSEAEMQAIATEVGYPETAFVVPGAAERQIGIRYFSPQAEVPFCGHATIATAVVLAERDGTGEFTFDTRVGPVVVQTAVAGGELSAAFTSVEPQVREFEADAADELLAVLGIERSQLDERWPLREAFAGNWHPVVAVADDEAFDTVSFDADRLRERMNARGWTGTVTLVRGSATPEDGAIVFDARNLFPVGEINEDPATGSAAAAFGGYLRALGLVDTPARVIVLQGQHIGRPSRLVVDIPDAGGIVVAGTAQPIE